MGNPGCDGLGAGTFGGIGLSAVWSRRFRPFTCIGRRCKSRGMVPMAGLEPAQLALLPPQDSVSTRFHHIGMASIIAMKLAALHMSVLYSTILRSVKQIF